MAAFLKKKLPLPREPKSVPEFRPTSAEFADFWGYIGSLAKIGQEHGAIKIIPPQEWKARETYDGADPLIRACASQTIEGDSGVYKLNIEDGGSIFLSDLVGLINETEAEGGGELNSDPRTAEMEFWRSIGMGSHLVYTAHSQNATLFMDSSKEWNLGKMRGSVRISPRA